MKSNQATSLSLLDRLRQPNNDQDWELFLSIYRPFIRRHLIGSGIQQPDVDDVLQESLTDMWVALPKFQHNGRIGAFRKWMKTIVARKAYRMRKQNQELKPAQLPAGDTVESLDSPLEQMMEREHDEHVVKFLLSRIRNEFTETTWTAFELQVLNGKNASEVADLIGVTINSVLISKSRVLRRLRQLGKGMVDC